MGRGKERLIEGWNWLYSCMEYHHETPLCNYYFEKRRSEKLGSEQHV
jgi:hypothetical protein